MVHEAGETELMALLPLVEDFSATLNSVVEIESWYEDLPAPN